MDLVWLQFVKLGKFRSNAPVVCPKTHVIVPGFLLELQELRRGHYSLQLSESRQNGRQPRLKQAICRLEADFPGSPPCLFHVFR